MGTSRTPVLDICHDMEELCPDAGSWTTRTDAIISWEQYDYHPHKNKAYATVFRITAGQLWPAYLGPFEETSYG